MPYFPPEDEEVGLISDSDEMLLGGVGNLRSTAADFRRRDFGFVFERPEGEKSISYYILPLIGAINKREKLVSAIRLIA